MGERKRKRMGKREILVGEGRGGGGRRGEKGEREEDGGRNREGKEGVLG